MSGRYSSGNIEFPKGPRNRVLKNKLGIVRVRTFSKCVTISSSVSRCPYIMAVMSLISKGMLYEPSIKSPIVVDFVADKRDIIPLLDQSWRRVSVVAYFLHCLAACVGRLAARYESQNPSVCKIKLQTGGNYFISP